MQTKMCPNGHRYDPNIYGDQCPLCAQGAQPSQNFANPRTNIANGPVRQAQPDGHTHVANPQPRPVAPTPAPKPAQPRNVDGETMVRGNQGAHTVIRHAGAPQADNSRRLVGFLVTYNRTPAGKAYNLYEGRNTIGRDRKCDVCVADDNMMSGTHLSILYRAADNKFKFRDEQSSNGTYVNKEITDEGELSNYDIIRAGGTIFIFIAIPKI